LEDNIKWILKDDLRMWAGFIRLRVRTRDDVMNILINFLFPYKADIYSLAERLIASQTLHCFSEFVN
jgi:hypothetical protein